MRGPGKRGRQLAGRAIRRRSLRRGLLGDQRVWRAIFYVIAARRMSRKVLGKDAQQLGTEKLKPGESMIVQAIDPRAVRKESRRERKARVRAGTVTAK